MILRLWRAQIIMVKADAYLKYQLEVGPPGYRSVDGNKGILVLSRSLGELYEIAMMTLWESLDSIRQFAGDPPDRARYYNRDSEFLLDPPDKVDHFEVLAQANMLDGEPRERPTIVRLWKCRVLASRSEEANAHEAAIGIPGYSSIAGNCGVYMIGRELGEFYEIGMVTLWTSLDAIRAFAGEPIDRAKYAGYDGTGLDYLIDPPEKVDHFTIHAGEFPTTQGGSQS